MLVFLFAISLFSSDFLLSYKIGVKNNRVVEDNIYISKVMVKRKKEFKNFCIIKTNEKGSLYNILIKNKEKLFTCIKSAKNVDGILFYYNGRINDFAEIYSNSIYFRAKLIKPGVLILY